MAFQSTHEDDATGAPDTPAVPLTRGLSLKLLVLTVIFVMVAEVLIFIPSVANFGQQWMGQRLRTVAAVGVVLLRGEADSLTREASNDILMATGAKAIAVREEGVARLLVVSQMPPEVDMHVDLDAVGPVDAIGQAFSTLFFGGNRMIRVFGDVGEGGREFEVIMPDAPLRSAMLTYARNVGLLSLLISIFTATLVFAAINRVMIRPIRAMTRSMLAFGQAPDDPSRVIRPENRDDEIGIAERELAQMQRTLLNTLGERKRLADLGLAVSKINHDMRNMLASAHLISDRLATIEDPTVQSLTPRLLRTLDRAVSYSEGVLAYGRTQEEPPRLRRVRLRALVDDVLATLPVEADGEIALENQVEPDLEIRADPDQLFRVLANLSRNAVQAMGADSDSATVRALSIASQYRPGMVTILVSDTGPGLPTRARKNLFAAFKGAAKSGGTGLGLAIAHELVRAHGGTLELVESIPGSTVFAIELPTGDAEIVPTGALAAK